jgi:hypothetical protein
MKKSSMYKIKKNILTPSVLVIKFDIVLVRLRRAFRFWVWWFQLFSYSSERGLKFHVDFSKNETKYTLHSHSVFFAEKVTCVNYVTLCTISLQQLHGYFFTNNSRADILCTNRHMLILLAECGFCVKSVISDIRMVK